MTTVWTYHYVYRHVVYTISTAFIECQTLMEITGLTHCLIRIVDMDEAGNIEAEHLREMLEKDQKVMDCMRQTNYCGVV